MDPTEPLSFEDKLIAVQKNLKAPKDKINDFAKYKYRKAEDILENAKPLLSEYGLLLTINDEIVEVGGRVYVRAAATIGDGTRTLTATAYAREQAEKKGLDEAQITGSASSYARKYALSGLFLLDDSEADPDTNEYHQQTRPHTPPAAAPPAKPPAPATKDKPITNQQKGQLFALAGEIAEANGWPREWAKATLYQHFNVESTTQLTTAQAYKAIRALYAVKDKGETFFDALTQTNGD